MQGYTIYDAPLNMEPKHEKLEVSKIEEDEVVERARYIKAKKIEIMEKLGHQMKNYIIMN